MGCVFNLKNDIGEENIHLMEKKIYGKVLERFNKNPKLLLIGRNILIQQHFNFFFLYIYFYYFFFYLN